MQVEVVAPAKIRLDPVGRVAVVQVAVEIPVVVLQEQTIQVEEVEDHAVGIAKAAPVDLG
jgi:hypothetical protein